MRHRIKIFVPQTGRYCGGTAEHTDLLLTIGIDEKSLKARTTKLYYRFGQVTARLTGKKTSSSIAAGTAPQMVPNAEQVTVTVMELEEQIARTVLEAEDLAQVEESAMMEEDVQTSTPILPKPSNKRQHGQQSKGGP